MSDRFLKGPLLYTSPDGRVKVHSGTDLSCNRQSVALKYQLHSSLQEANISLREAFNQARLSHPNICRVVDCTMREMISGQVETVLAMEYMEEGDLMREIERRMQLDERWNEAEVLVIVEKIALALAYAQENGICHRDIKPQNIFISHESTIKVGDFGSSSSLTDLATSLSLQGSPFYLSPELKSHYIRCMTEGQTRIQHDPFKSDIYSLGVMVLFMVRLRCPMELANLMRLREKTLKLIEECGEYPKVQKIVREMLEIEPERRISLADLIKMIRSAKNTHFEEIIESGLEPDRPVLYENKPISPIIPQENKGNVCSLPCEKRLIASCYGKCLACEVNRDHIPKAAVPIALPCGHFYHDISCLYSDLERESEGFRVSVPYKCRNCKAFVPIETLENAFCTVNLVNFGKKVRKCAICKELPGIYVMKCHHSRCPKCELSLHSICPCSNSCVLS